MVHVTAKRAWLCAPVEQQVSRGIANKSPCSSASVDQFSGGAKEEVWVSLGWKALRRGFALRSEVRGRVRTYVFVRSIDFSEFGVAD